MKKINTSSNKGIKQSGPLFFMYLLGHINNEITRKSRQANRDKTHDKIKDNLMRKRWQRKRKTCIRPRRPFLLLDWMNGVARDKKNMLLNNLWMPKIDLVSDVM